MSAAGSAGQEILGEDVKVRTEESEVGVLNRVHWFGVASMEWFLIS